MRKLLLLAVLLLPLVGVQGQDDSTTLRIVFAGDIMGHTPQHKAALGDDGRYDYEPSFRYVSDYIRSVDLAIANLEVTLAGPPYTGYPQFSSPVALAEAAREAGFDILTTANNHCMDRGRTGLERTLRALDTLGIPHLGTYADTLSRMDRHPMMIDCRGIRLALLCYTYGTNGIEVRPPNVVNMIDTVLMQRDLQAAHERGADYTVALIHWGIEYQVAANREQQELAAWLLEHGADAIIGGHPHVVQNFTIDALPGNDRYPEPVVYSMGNFVSNQRDENCDGGIMVEMELRCEGDSVRMVRMAYLPYWVHRGTMDGRYHYYVVPSTDAIEHPDLYQIEAEMLPALQRFGDNTRRRLERCTDTPETACPIVENHYYHAMQPAQKRVSN